MSDQRFTEGELRTVLFATEHDSNPTSLRRFSYAGGKSTYSFGLLQFDVGARPAARNFLRENGFTTDDIKRLRGSGGLADEELRILNAKLQAVPDSRLNEFTDGQLRESIRRIDSLVEHLKKSNAPIAVAISHSKELQLALADYDNQFHIDGIGSRAGPNTMLAYLEGHPVRRNGEVLQLSDTLARRDIQNYIDGTGYAVAHPRSVSSREERLVGALSRLGVGRTTWVADAQPSVPFLQIGATGREVADLQERLARLGYTDAKGRSLAPDGRFGPITQVAVKAFQRDRGLAADGKVGPLTHAAMDAVLEDRQIAGAGTHRSAGAPRPIPDDVAQTPAFSEPDHPQRALYAALQSMFPGGTSEARLCQAVAACRGVGIHQPGELASVIGTDHVIFFGSREPGRLMGQMDISRPAPPTEQSLQLAQHQDALQAQGQLRMQPEVQYGPVPDLQ